MKNNKDALRKKKEQANSGYEESLKSLYRLLLTAMFLAVGWLAYDAFSTAKRGYDSHKAKQQEMEKRFGKKQSDEETKSEEDEGGR